MRSVWSARLLRVTGRISINRSIDSGVHNMAGGTNDHGNGSLDRRLSEIRDSRKIGTDQPGSEGGNGAARASAMALGFRLSSELIAGVVVGALLGWAFDHLLSTSPWGLIVFVLLGFTAGVVNVVRSAGAAPDRTSR